MTDIETLAYAIGYADGWNFTLAPPMAKALADTALFVVYDRGYGQGWIDRSVSERDA